MDFLPNRVVDVGYVSWLYGVYPEATAAWGLKRLEFRGDLMVLDSPYSLRQEYWGDYKANRRENVSEEQKERVARVRKFRKQIGKDWLLNTVLIDGFEADDVVSILALYAITPEVHVIGVDKDFLQLPPFRIKMSTLDGSLSSIGKFRKRLPKKVKFLIKEPVDVLFTLALLGDRADNIPRIVPPYHLEEFIDIMEAPDLEARANKAREYYGGDFDRNIYLAVLPGPWAYDPVPDENEVLERIAAGTYYDQELSTEVKQKVLGAYYCKFPFEAKIINKS